MILKKKPRRPLIEDPAPQKHRQSPRLPAGGLVIQGEAKKYDTVYLKYSTVQYFLGGKKESACPKMQMTKRGWDEGKSSVKAGNVAGSLFPPKVLEVKVGFVNQGFAPKPPLGLLSSLQGNRKTSPLGLFDMYRCTHSKDVRKVFYVVVCLLFSLC